MELASFDPPPPPPPQTSKTAVVAPAGTVQVPSAFMPITQSAAHAWEAAPKESNIKTFEKLVFIIFPSI
ncbi:hypothetical protein ACCQ08_00315 [Comamonas sp. SY3]|uniref:hypothetical protein n=1 Tax=Comamonas sp. SY3 TaxID=3243601 RepID=UPI0035933FC5